MQYIENFLEDHKNKTIFDIDISVSEIGKKKNEQWLCGRNITGSWSDNYWCHIKLLIVEPKMLSFDKMGCLVDRYSYLHLLRFDKPKNKNRRKNQTGR